VKQLAQQLNVNRTFLAGYLKALENQGYVKSKKIGLVKCVSTEKKDFNYIYFMALAPFYREVCRSLKLVHRTNGKRSNKPH
jgi:DNA-binding transcriptional regulator YhcF (GntR family)